MLKAKFTLCRSILERRYGGLWFESAARRTYRARGAAVGEQRIANRAAPCVFCSHGPTAFRSPMGGSKPADLITLSAWRVGSSVAHQPTLSSSIGRLEITELQKSSRSCQPAGILALAADISCGTLEVRSATTEAWRGWAAAIAKKL
jgi:hypothetical protein